MKRFDEKFDSSVVKQTSGISCISAVSEMLLKNRGINVSQQIILDVIEELATASSLAKVLNEFDNSAKTEKWHGTVTDDDSLEILLKRKNWAVILREPLERFGHAVVIDSKTRGGLIKIKDPFDQTSYKMTKTDFLNYWGGEVIFYGTVK